MYIFLCIAGLPQSQEKSEKTKKMTKVSKKWGVFEKKSGNMTKFGKMLDFVCLNLQSSLFSKAFK